MQSYLVGLLALILAKLAHSLFVRLETAIDRWIEKLLSWLDTRWGIKHEETTEAKVVAFIHSLVTLGEEVFGQRETMNMVLQRANHGQTDTILSELQKRLESAPSVKAWLDGMTPAEKELIDELRENTVIKTAKAQASLALSAKTDDTTALAIHAAVNGPNIEKMVRAAVVVQQLAPASSLGRTPEMQAVIESVRAKK